ncbi:MAG: DUF5597 domain-containing protein [Planctomycetota bacterium]|nr:DUF5597 domain-containing protein [Planctomycetota bacterium]
MKSETARTKTVRAIPRLEKRGTATQLIVDGKPFVMLAGEVHNSSASSREYMESVWERVVALHCNTAIVPVYWELLEPAEGKYDFTLVDGLLKGARKHHLKLALLWFATWKNAYSSYTPAWVKTALERFFRAQTADGKNTNAISCMCDAACVADARACAALMRHLRKADPQHTVLAVQIENETGILGQSRDHCPAAERAFASAVPAQLLEHLQARGEGLVPELKEVWNPGAKGTWAEVFGAGADEVFMAWHVARYVNRVAGAGKSEYPLPLYANAWLVQHASERPGQYPSGGPVSRMMNVWHAAAPAIDLLAPDIYLEDFKGVCASYTRGGNPLFIPEARRDESAAANVFHAIAQCDAICFAPFGIEGIPADGPLSKSYALLASALPVVAERQGTGTMLGILQSSDAVREADLGGFRLRIKSATPYEKTKVPSFGLVIALAADEYLVAGANIAVDFLPLPGGLPNVEQLFHEEGRYENGEWIPGRRLNGDEYAVVLHEEPGLRRVKLFSRA